MKGRRYAMLILLGLGMGIFGLKRCSPPPPPGDFTRPGNDGGARPPKIDREIAVTVNPRGNSFTDPALTELACGTPYKIISSAAENTGSCAGYRYDRLLGMAEAPVVDRFLSLKCPTGCGPKSSRRTYLKFACSGNRATVAMKLEVVCPNEGETPPTEAVSDRFSMAVSTEIKVSGETPDLTPPSRRGELITDLTIGATMSLVLKCPEKRTFAIRYEENEPGHCASFSDYAPYVARAEERARGSYYGFLRCDSGCAKAPFATQRREWSCDATSSNVVVKVWFTAECK